MIIPIRCMSCGKVIADKWRYYQEQLKAIKKDDSVEKYYFDGKKVPDTAEKKVLDSLNMIKTCCRKHFLTQIDLLERI